MGVGYGWKRDIDYKAILQSSICILYNCVTGWLHYIIDYVPITIDPVPHDKGHFHCRKIQSLPGSGERWKDGSYFLPHRNSNPRLYFPCVWNGLQFVTHAIQILYILGIQFILDDSNPVATLGTNTGSRVPLI